MTQPMTAPRISQAQPIHYRPAEQQIGVQPPPPPPLPPTATTTTPAATNTTIASFYLWQPGEQSRVCPSEMVLSCDSDVLVEDKSNQ